MSIADDEDRSVTRQIAALKAGDAGAAAQLWGRYFDRLVGVARKRLAGAPRRIADEEDVALSVFDSLCRGAARGRFPDLSDRDDLWRLLLVITQQKAVDQIRRQTRKKRGGTDVRGESVFVGAGDDGRPAGLDQFMGEEPTPEFLALLGEQHRRLLDALPDPVLRQIALWRMESYTTEEIAAELGIASRSVERKVRLIRKTWQRIFEDPRQ